ncbi:TolB family protein [Pontimicrobium aquaticum]|nr:DUF5050 domain-containing protein [Pontimicrobium aquaticum]
MKKSILFCVLFTNLFLASCSYAQEKIVFVKNREIHSMDPDGGNIKQLTNYKVPGHTPISCRPSISKSGKICYIYDPLKHGWMSTYIMNIDGSNKRRLTNEPKSKDSGTWNSTISPNGHYVVFSSLRTNNHEKIYRMNIDGSELISISNNTKGYPKWSPDSKYIIYETSNSIKGNDIVITDINGNNKKTLIKSKDNLRYPTFSKDGKMIAFIKQKSNYAELIVANSNGKNQKKLLDIDKWSRISFSSDSKSIVFVSKNERISTINLDGTDYKELTKGRDPVWSF